MHFQQNGVTLLEERFIVRWIIQTHCFLECFVMSKQHHQLKWKVYKGSSVQTSHLQRILSLNPELFWLCDWGQQPVMDGNGAIFISSDTGIRGMEWWENNTSTTSLRSCPLQERRLLWTWVCQVDLYNGGRSSSFSDSRLNKSPVSNLLCQTSFETNFVCLKVFLLGTPILVDSIEQKE